MIQYLLFLVSDITPSLSWNSHRGGWRKLMFIKYLVKKNALLFVVGKTGSYDSPVTSVIYWALCWEKIYVFSTEPEAGSHFSCNWEVGSEGCEDTRWVASTCKVNSRLKRVQTLWSKFRMITENCEHNCVQPPETL